MRFFFTVHRADMIRRRLIPGCSIMAVASGQWDGDRFRTARPPRGHVGSLCLDSGGFTAAKRWGDYPWTAKQYAAWARKTSANDRLDFVAVMDLACERGVNRDVFATNQQRILASVVNAGRCREADPSLPWLPVVQGATVEDYLGCAELYRRDGWGLDYAGLGTMCGRKASDAARVLCELSAMLPDTRWHVFGMSLGVLRFDDARPLIRSWDSYAWNWGKGAKNDACRMQRNLGETYSGYCRRLAEDYARRVDRLIRRPRQMSLF